MEHWTVTDTADGLLELSMLPPRRSVGRRKLTWADLLRPRLRSARVYVLYFPSRFDTASDRSVADALLTFGKEAGSATSVNIWSPKDPALYSALAFFGIKAPPAVVLVPGFQLAGVTDEQHRPRHLYAVVLTDAATLSDRERLVPFVNTAHEIVVRGDPKAISFYLQRREFIAVLKGVQEIVGSVWDQLLRLKPRLLLPDGTTVTIGE